jgi:recombination protein RecA
LARDRVKLEDPENFFSVPNENLEFISSGCEVLNRVLGGGYVFGRMTNIVGDKSTGKTLLCIEACANCLNQYPDVKIYYREAEAAFDESYAEALGMPVNSIDFGDPDKPLETVEDLFEDLNRILDKLGKDDLALYVLDSLDALTDRAEVARGIDEGSFGASKAKKLSEFFRRTIRKLEKKKLCFIVVSQVRDNIGVMFGDKHTRSGGRAIDFFASQILWLSQIKTVTRTIKRIKRPVGIEVRARCKKNKIGLPMRECEFKIIFGYGIHDLGANLSYLKAVDKLGEFDGLTDKEIDAIIRNPDYLNDDEFFDYQKAAIKEVNKAWGEVETSFLPKRNKYK